jgi:hypothetical protein
MASIPTRRCKRATVRIAWTRDDYLDTLTAAKLYPPTRRPTDPTDVEPHHLSAELLDALTSATNQT